MGAYRVTGYLGGEASLDNDHEDCADLDATVPVVQRMLTEYPLVTIEHPNGLRIRYEVKTTVEGGGA